MAQARRQGWIRNIFARFYGNNFEVSGVRANIFWGFMEVILRLQEGGRILFEVGRSSVPIRDFSMEFPLHIWKGTPWQFQNTEIEKEDLISWLYALYSQTALRTQTTKYSTVHFVLTRGQFCGRLLIFFARSFKVLGIRFLQRNRFCLTFNNHISQL